MNIEAEANERVRLAIMKILRGEYPSHVDSMVIMYGLKQLGYEIETEEMHTHLWYMNETGRVEAQRRKAADFDLVFARLTAAGVDHLEERNCV